MAASSSSGGMSHGVAKRVSSRASQICPSDAYERNLQSRDYSCAAKRERDRQRRALHEGAPTNDRVPHAQPQDATELLPLPPHAFLHIDSPDNQRNTLPHVIETQLHFTQLAIILCEYDADVIAIVDEVNEVLPLLQCNFLSKNLRDDIKAHRWECCWRRMFDVFVSTHVEFQARDCSQLAKVDFLLIYGMPRRAIFDHKRITDVQAYASLLDNLTPLSSVTMFSDYDLLNSDSIVEILRARGMTRGKVPDLFNVSRSTLFQRIRMKQNLVK